jgi:hypothetical protein
MKSLIKGLAMLAALVMLGVGSLHAAEPTTPSAVMSKIVEKYEDTDDVMCLAVGRGLTLEMLKMNLNKSLGKEFMKGVKGITIIEYSDASAQVCAALRKDLNAFTSLLEELDPDDGQGSKNEYKRVFANMKNAESGKISDFVIAIEDEESKIIMYMEGDLDITALKN